MKNRKLRGFYKIADDSGYFLLNPLRAFSIQSSPSEKSLKFHRSFPGNDLVTWRLTLNNTSEVK